jgi:hypothetical protein
VINISEVYGDAIKVNSPLTPIAEKDDNPLNIQDKE